MKKIGNQLKAVTIDELNERIEIIKVQTRRNKKGDIVKEEAERFKVWSKVLPIGSRRTKDGKLELENEISYRITIRYRDDIKSEDIVEWRGKRLKQINSGYDLEGRKRYLVMEVKEDVH